MVKLVKKTVKKVISKNKQYFVNIKRTVSDVDIEVSTGLKILNSIDNKIVSVFGTHNLEPRHPYYINCEETCYRLGVRGYAIMSGGGPGIMEASNTGATRANTVSIGFKAGLLKKEQLVNKKIFTHQLSFKYLFARRFCLAIKSDALVFYPGGYGTLNEFFEYVTLIQTGMVDPVPVICVNKEYWKGMFKWLKEKTLKENFIQQRHLDGIYFAETPQEVVKIIREKA
ncbi:MAG TPA: TIGR00730 family Rossman fold protein [Alphaproteobacteria bacterium]|nr:TIGR00730 family Rossman fold protein [Alphaproteobacteria bacterium]